MQEHWNQETKKGSGLELGIQEIQGIRTRIKFFFGGGGVHYSFSS